MKTIGIGEEEQKDAAMKGIGMSGADIELVCREAGLKAIADEILGKGSPEVMGKVTKEHLEEALKGVQMKEKKDSLLFFSN
eukprot:CAMPEP_0170555430 /NCGR_PEP_ID=MMETSP0211-20121228/13327_1 /TAXON_ID=311385 /ORGANISM="Pseudokeronopsis sp., Strain OXSARD2" /LENGTH=80 /DNA_ID=CAMNT_0010865257 /DNA_START=174 /DNA_END=414 /DNA_ORIENTATION=-